MEWFFLLVVFAVIFGLARVFQDTWRAFRDKKRSIATALAITCIVGGVPVLLVENYFEQKELLTVQHVFRVVGLTLFFGAGISGAIGLIWDRRIAKHQTESRAIDHANKLERDDAS